MKNVRWGLLSTANINRNLIPPIRSSQRGTLTAVASRDPEKANTYAAKWEIPHVFGSYEAMLDSGMVDAVYIGLPNHLHAEWSIKAMEQGIHVLCEKPFAISLDEVDAMIAASKKYNCVLAEAFMYRHHPQTKIAGEWAHNGKLGQINFVRSVFNFFLEDRGNIRLVPEYGGGSLWDVGVYPLSFAQFIMGESPQWVNASQQIGQSGVDEHLGGYLQYNDGRYAQISSGFNTPFYMTAEIVGTEGRLLLESPFVGQNKGKMIFYPKNEEPREIQVPDKDLYLGQVEDMHAAILDGAENYLSLDETRNHVKTVLALYQAANKNKIIHLD